MPKPRRARPAREKAAAPPEEPDFIEVDITDTPEFLYLAGIEPRLYEGVEPLVLRFPRKPRDDQPPAPERVTAEQAFWRSLARVAHPASKRKPRPAKKKPSGKPPPSRKAR
jgi:hypothetical protein